MTFWLTSSMSACLSEGATMRAIRLVAYGDAIDGVEVHDLPEPPPPGPGEVLIQMCYAPVNVSDLMVVWGVYSWKPQPPEVLGNEGAGEVLAVGEGVTGLVPGMPVAVPFMARSWRERLVVPASLAVALPADADLQQSSMATINAVTASMLLDDYVDLQPGDAVVFNAGTSGLAQWLVGLARGRGLRAIALVRKEADIARVQAIGCEVVLVDEDGVASAPALRGLNVRLALDGVGGASARRLAELLAVGGSLVAYAAASHEPMEVSAQHLIFKRINVHGFFEGHPENASRVPGVLNRLKEFLRPNGIRQPVAAVYPMAQVKEAVAHALKGGKVLLSFGGDRQ
ncbi:MDR family NADPH-dependent oxidoreductase [Roseateles chitinivorans]|uniref:MDR family NADPH-dependent oxidoreductase n=1 Tax=Roseateles chitinivorans TaxID=2917965 RepID=UPI003D672812